VEVTDTGLGISQLIQSKLFKVVGVAADLLVVTLPSYALITLSLFLSSHRTSFRATSPLAASTEEQALG
jgi:hypothetical protein